VPADLPGVAAVLDVDPDVVVVVHSAHLCACVCVWAVVVGVARVCGGACGVGVCVGGGGACGVCGGAGEGGGRVYAARR
jgi:hypothetical protein